MATIPPRAAIVWAAQKGCEGPQANIIAWSDNAKTSHWERTWLGWPIKNRKFNVFEAAEPMMTMKRLLTAWFLVWLAGPAIAGPYEDGRAAYGRGDYATAFRLWLPLAERGDAKAQYNIGTMYYEGRGVPRDYVYVFAYRWFSLAASQGNRDAAHKRDFITKFMTPEQILEARYGGGAEVEGVIGTNR